MGAESIYARALQGGVKGGMGAIAKSDERQWEQFEKKQDIETKFNWGNYEAAQKRAENLQRFKDERRFGALGRADVRQEGIEATKGALGSKMEYLGASQEDLDAAMDFLDKGGNVAEWTGTPGSTLSPAQAKSLAEAVASIAGEDATPEERLELYKVMGGSATSGKPGLKTKKAAMMSAAEAAEAAKVLKKKVDGGATALTQRFATDKAGSLGTFKKIHTKDPEFAQQLLDQLIADGNVGGAEIKEMKRIIAGKSDGTVLPDRGFIQIPPTTPAAKQKAVMSIPGGSGDTGEFN